MALTWKTLGNGSKQANTRDRVYTVSLPTLDGQGFAHESYTLTITNIRTGLVAHHYGYHLAENAMTSAASHARITARDNLRAWSILTFVDALARQMMRDVADAPFDDARFALVALSDYIQERELYTYSVHCGVQDALAVLS